MNTSNANEDIINDKDKKLFKSGKNILQMREEHNSLMVKLIRAQGECLGTGSR